MANKHRTEANHGDKAYTLTSRHMTAHRELTDWHKLLLLRGHLSMELAELFTGQLRVTDLRRRVRCYFSSQKDTGVQIIQ